MESKNQTGVSYCLQILGFDHSIANIIMVDSILYLDMPNKIYFKAMLMQI